MTNGATAGATAAAAARQQAIAQAIKASGAIVRVEPDQFLKILPRGKEPLVVTAEKGGLFGSGHQYLTSYRGLVFYTKSSTPLALPGKVEVIVAQKIWIP